MERRPILGSNTDQETVGHLMVQLLSVKMGYEMQRFNHTRPEEIRVQIFNMHLALITDSGLGEPVRTSAYFSVYNANTLDA